MPTPPSSDLHHPVGAQGRLRQRTPPAEAERRCQIPLCQSGLSGIILVTYPPAQRCRDTHIQRQVVLPGKLSPGLLQMVLITGRLYQLTGVMHPFLIEENLADPMALLQHGTSKAIGIRRRLGDVAGAGDQ